jgi:hypothetical protein
MKKELAADRSLKKSNGKAHLLPDLFLHLYSGRSVCR